MKAAGVRVPTDNASIVREVSIEGTSAGVEKKKKKKKDKGVDKKEPSTSASADTGHAASLSAGRSDNQEQGDPNAMTGGSASLTKTGDSGAEFRYRDSLEEEDDYNNYVDVSGSINQQSHASEEKKSVSTTAPNAAQIAAQARKEEESKELKKSLQEVEERLKTREQFTLTIMNVDVSDLPAAHRFTKNYPWLKGSYGAGYSWVADFVEGGEDEVKLAQPNNNRNNSSGSSSSGADDVAKKKGESAEWKNLRWAFNLERNDRDRSDLVLAVCSKNIVIGRYVLMRDEFADIPDTKSGYFEVSGEIMSGLGPAGKIKVLFLKSKAERPRGAMAGATAPSPTKQQLLNNTFGDSAVLASVSAALDVATTPGTLKHAAMFCSKVFVKIVSTAVMDLKAVHFLDTNCPFVVVECGDWVGISDVVHNAGMAARWNSLNWKFAVTEEQGFELMIHSKTVLIGKLHVSLDDIVSCTAKGNGIIEIIKHITNGKDITGKVKINLLAHVEDVPKTSQPPSLAGSPVAKGRQEYGDAVNTSQDGDGGAGGNGRLPLINSTTADVQNAGDMILMKPFLKPPFIINVRDVTVLDTVKMHIFQKNNLTVNVVCGTWGKATEEIRGAGNYAHWVGLGWKILVKEDAFFRVTVWSSGKVVGAASLSIKDLLEMPTDYERNTEIFAKLMNEKKEITGKIKITCKYDVYLKEALSPTKKKSPAKGSASFAGSPSRRSQDPSKKLVSFDEGDYDGDPARSSSLPQLGASFSQQQAGDTFASTASKAVNAVNNGAGYMRTTSTSSPDRTGTGAGGEEYGENGEGEGDMDDLPDNLFPRDMLALPLVAVVSSIALYDMVAAHRLRRNSPQVKFVCDRKSAVTEAQSGAGSVATWSNLQWMMKIRADSHVMVLVFSGNKSLGRVDISPQDLLETPITDSGITEIKTMVTKDGLTTAKLMIRMVLRNVEGSSNAPGTLPSGRVIPGGVGAFDWNSSLISAKPNVNPDADPNAGYSPTNSRSGSPVNLGGTGGGAQQYQSHHDSSVFGGGSIIYNTSSFMPNATGTPYNSSYYQPPMSQSFNDYDPSQRPQSWAAPAFSNKLFNSQNPTTIFDPSVLTANNAHRLGLRFDLHVKEVDLIDLKPMHRFARNCPAVSAACGKWLETSKVLNNAGETGYWTNLNWKLTFKGSAVLRLMVNSKRVMVGAVNFPSEVLLAALTDDKGLRRVSGVLIDEEGTTNGKIKVAYTMQVNTRALSPSTEQRHERSSQQQQHLRRVASQGDVAGDMSVMSGHSINSGLSGYASATHGASGAGANSRGRSLSPQRNQSASAALGFGKPPIGQQNRGPSAPNSPAVGSRGYQQQRPFSGMSSAPSETFGFSPVNSRPASASVNAAAARTAAAFGAAVQNNPNANAFRGAGAGGAPGGSRFPSAAASHHGAHGPHGPSFVSALGMLGATSYDEDEDEDPRRHVEFPFNVTVLEISAVDLAKVHTLSKNQPYIRAFCDEFYSETEPQAGAGEVNTFRAVNWSFNVHDKSVFKLLVCSRDKDIGAAVVDLDALKNTPLDRNGHREVVLTLRNDKLVTTGKIRLIAKLLNAKIQQFEADAAELQGVGEARGPGGSFEVGEAAFENSLEGPGAGLAPTAAFAGAGAGAGMRGSSSVNMVQQQQQSQRTQSGPFQSVRGPVGGGSVSGAASVSSGMGAPNPQNISSNNSIGFFTGTGASVVGSIGGTGSRAGSPSRKASANVTNNRNFDYFLLSQKATASKTQDNYQGFMEIVLVGIAAIDMTKAHTFAENSPKANVACGKFSATTSVKENAGKMANWEGLQFTFTMDRVATLRLLITSKDTMLGSCNISRLDLLSGRKNQRGVYVYFDELETANGKAAGKLKLMYTITPR